MRLPKGKMKAVLAGILAVSFLTGCSATQSVDYSQLEGLEEMGIIEVVSREEGSGTRSVFAEEIGFWDNSTGRDLTRPDSLIAESGEEVMEKVQESDSSIGYVSAGVLGDIEGVHAVKVDGSPLTRSFYLAYSGSLSEVEQDFLTYIRGAGQEIVAQDYTAVRKITTFLSGKPEGSVRVGGSSSVAGLMTELAESYMSINPNAQIEIVITDSTNGLTGAMSGIYDIGMASRDLKDYEKELLEYVEIAQDEIAVIVNDANPLENISSEDLKKIYTGEICEWKELYHLTEEEH